MKIRLFMVLCIGCLGLLSGCACSTCGSSYYDYASECGSYSCTDNSGFEEYNNPCPGPYQCTYNQ